MKVIKQGSLAALLSVLSIFATSVHAEGSFLGFGAGLMFNLGQLGGTITNDGLKSVRAKPTYDGAGLAKGCLSPLNTLSAAEKQNCLGAETGTEQDGIIPNRTLKDYEKNVPAGLLESKVSGAMTGLVLNVFYEKELSSWSFVRVDLSYNKRIRGGQSSSTILGIEWYKDNWDYKAWVIPAYFGIKAKIGESAAVYGGAGVNYHRGGWSVSVTSIGDLPSSLLGTPIGAVTVVETNTLTGVKTTTGGPIINGGTSFRTEGFGFNVLIGLEGKLASGNRVFFEIDTLIAGDTESGNVSEIGGQVHLARIVNKPIILAGTTYRFGYKMGM
jgi:opacity protein-like surface antigen